MTVSFEAVPHSPSSGVAQPQSSMKESHPAKLHLQEVDQTATASSTSNKSTSLQLLLLLHTTAGIAALRRRNGCSCTALCLKWLRARALEFCAAEARRRRVFLSRPNGIRNVRI